MKVILQYIREREREREGEIETREVQWYWQYSRVPRNVVVDFLHKLINIYLVLGITCSARRSPMRDTTENL